MNATRGWGLAYYVVIVYLPDEPGSVEKGEMVHFYEIRVYIREEGMVFFCRVDTEGSNLV